MNTYRNRRWLLASAAVLVVAVLAGLLLTSAVYAQGPMWGAGWTGQARMGNMMGNTLMRGRMGYGFGATGWTTDTTGYGYGHPWGMMGGYGMGATAPLTGTVAPYGCPCGMGMMGWGWNGAAEPTVTADQALALAADYLDAYLPGATIGEQATLNGKHYLVPVLRDGEAAGTIVVSAYSGRVWFLP
ncbi:MAG TPA: hypothetical protein VNK95_05435 [Caldilineaceae bacterium]|nr:hypothetical protein [Caldilineaceae bacterium]